VSELSRLTDAHLRIDAAVPLSVALIDEINHTCDAIENSPKDITLLVELEGRSGVHGTDLWPAGTEIYTVNKWEQALRRLERLPAPTLSVVRGACSGPALDVMLATDYRLSTADASFRVPMAGRATWPGMGLYRMANQLGLSRARRLGLLGLEVPAERALQYGLIDDVTTDTVDIVRAVLDSLAGTSGKELAIRRQLLAEAVSTTYEDAVGSHLAACDRALRTERTGVDSAA
jgi:isomerase DpgB